VQTVEQKKQHIVLPVTAQPEIGRWLWSLEDVRQRTKRCLVDLHPSLVDWSGSYGEHTIGTLLFHIAAIEISWLGIEVAEGKLSEKVWDEFPYEVRDEQGHLTIVKGLSLEEHLRRLDMVRGVLIETYRTMSLEEFRRVREFDDYHVTPEWVVHHLCQHEAEHRSEIAWLRTYAERDLGLV
jgi:uncharacterized damage-inducible protein DinB